MSGAHLRLSLARIVVATAFAPILATCGGGGGGGGDGGGGTPAGTDTITLSGNFTGGTNTAWFEKIFAKLFRPAYALDPNAVTRVVLIYPDGSMTQANVTAGRFTVGARRGVSVGVVFVGATNNFLGYLLLEEGLESMPLGKVSSATTTIDLQTLTSTGRKVRGSRDPIRQELELTADEVAAIKQANVLFANVIQGPDRDGNGVVDVLEGKHFSLSVFYEVRAGTFATAFVPTVDSTPTFRSYALQLAARGPSLPSQVTITDPGGAQTPMPRNFLDGNFATYLHGAVFTPAQPVAGTHTISGISATPLSFEIPDQAGFSANLVLPIPTVTVSSGVVQRVNWTYRLAGNANSTIDPRSLMQRVEVSFWLGNPPQAPTPLNGCTASPHLGPAVTQFIPQCQTPINWADVTRVDISYIDLYGNFVHVGWPKQAGF